jgi:hypothetical protein
VLLQATGGDDEVALTWQGVERGATAQVYGNGQLLAADLRGDRYEERSNRVRGLVCYSVTQRYADTGLTSPASEEACIDDPALIRMTVADHALTSAGGSAATVTADGEVSYYAQWGAPSQVLTSTFTAKSSGWHRFDLEYANALGPINTGITAAVKTVTVRCGGEAEQSGSVVMPHRGEVKWGYSTGFLFKARAAERCEARLADGFNMTYLAHFALYTGGRGGASGPLNGADIAAARVEFVGAVRQGHDLEPPFSGSR